MAKQHRTTTPIPTQQKPRTSQHAVTLRDTETLNEVPTSALLSEWERRADVFGRIALGVLDYLNRGVTDAREIGNALVPEYESLMPPEFTRESTKSPTIIRQYVDSSIKCANKNCGNFADEHTGVLVVSPVGGPRFTVYATGTQDFTWYCSGICAAADQMVKEANDSSYGRHEVIEALALRLKEIPIWADNNEFPCPPVDVRKMQDAAGVDRKALKRIQRQDARKSKPIN